MQDDLAGVLTLLDPGLGGVGGDCDMVGPPEFVSAWYDRVLGGGTGNTHVLRVNRFR